MKVEFYVDEIEDIDVVAQAGRQLVVNQQRRTDEHNRSFDTATRGFTVGLSSAVNASAVPTAAIETPYVEQTPPVETVVTPEPEPATAPAASETDALDAMRRFVAAKSLPEAVTLLETFQARRVTDMDAETRAAFVQHVREVLA